MFELNALFFSPVMFPHRRHRIPHLPADASRCTNRSPLCQTSVETASSSLLAMVVGLPWVSCENQVVLAASIQAVELLLLLILRPRHTQYLYVLEVARSIGRLIVVITSQAGPGTYQPVGAIAGLVVTIVASV